MLHEVTRVVAIDELEPFPGNPRRGDVALIAESLAMHGQYRPLVVQASTMRVLAGNHTLKAARSLGWSEVTVTLVDIDDVAARKIVLMDNRSNDVASYSTDDLRELLEQLPDFEGTGWDQESVDALVFGVEQEPRGGGQRIGRSAGCRRGGSSRRRLRAWSASGGVRRRDRPRGARAAAG